MYRRLLIVSALAFGACSGQTAQVAQRSAQAKSAAPTGKGPKIQLQSFRSGTGQVVLLAAKNMGPVVWMRLPEGPGHATALEAMRHWTLSKTGAVGSPVADFWFVTRPHRLLLLVEASSGSTVDCHAVTNLATNIGAAGAWTAQPPDHADCLESLPRIFSPEGPSERMRLTTRARVSLGNWLARFRPSLEQENVVLELRRKADEESCLVLEGWGMAPSECDSLCLPEKGQGLPQAEQPGGVTLGLTTSNEEPWRFGCPQSHATADRTSHQP